jgi:soluble P-type ATPase
LTTIFEELDSQGLDLARMMMSATERRRISILTTVRESYVACVTVGYNVIHKYLITRSDIMATVLGPEI